MRVFSGMPSAGILKAAEKIGTPLYFYSADVIRRRFLKLKSVLPAGWKIFFAVKANPNIAVIKTFRELGAMAETASAGELLACFKAGFRQSMTALSGPAKGDAEFAVLMEKKVGVIHVESAEELAALNRLGVKLKVALRVNPDISPGKPGKAMFMVGGVEKFGFSAKDTVSILQNRHSYRNLDFCGFHIYLGTQILSAKTWLKGALEFTRWMSGICEKTGFNPSYVNFGGGLGIPYSDDEESFDLKTFKSGLKQVEALARKNDRLKSVRFFIEPGRYLVGPAGVYVMKVLAVKKIRNRNFALTDGGIHHALFPFRVSAEYPVKLLNRRSQGRKIRYILGGPLCNTLDQGALPVSLPELKPGDFLGIYQSGAYGYTASMQFFLSHPLAAEALADGDTVYLIRKPSATEHLFVNQVKRKIF